MAFVIQSMTVTTGEDASAVQDFVRTPVHPFRLLWERTYTGVGAEFHSDVLIATQSTIPGLFMLALVVQS